MIKKNLFNASFEESLNLEDDVASSEFIKRNLKETQEKEKYRGTLRSYVWLVISTVVFIYSPAWLIYFLNNYVYNHFDSKSLQAPSYNFLPNWLFWLLGFTWLVIILIGKRYYQRFILTYRGQFHLLVTYILWLLVEWNLFCLTGLSKSLSNVGTAVFLILNCYFIYVILRGRCRNLLKLLYGDVEEVSTGVNQVISQLVNNFMFLLGLVTIAWGIIKLFLSFFYEPDIGLGLMGAMGLWFFVNIIVAFFESYIILPFMLRGYYLLKYPEEYREWEGKTVEEWYGKRYLKKHKELLENE